MTGYRVLGSLALEGPDGLVEVTSRRARLVLAVLLLHANEPVAGPTLADALWGDDPPAHVAGPPTLTGG